METRIYFERKIDGELLRWKDSKYRKPLLLRGARQVGKSSAVRHLAEQFDNYVEINLELNPQYKTAFRQELEPKKICNDLSLLTGQPFEAGKTLLFIDEIQESQEAIRSLRFFYELYPELHVVAAGSLLEFALAELPSFGVGRIQSIFLYPFSFAEFLQVENPFFAQMLQEKTDYEPIAEALHEKAIQYIRQFIIIGGMPEVVRIWHEQHDYLTCGRAAADILRTYTDDFAKYKTRVSPVLLGRTLQSVAQQTGKRFIYNNVVNGIDSYKVRDALQLLTMAGLVIPATHSAGNGVPLGAETNEKFHKYLPLDTGIMFSLLGTSANNYLLFNNTELVNKGAATEVFVGLEILKSNRDILHNSLYYWENLKAGGQAEVDYLIERNGQVVPIEVKAGTKGSMKSMYYFLQIKNLPYGIRTSLENFGELEKVKILPLYALDKALG